MFVWKVLAAPEAHKQMEMTFVFIVNQGKIRKQKSFGTFLVLLGALQGRHLAKTSSCELEGTVHVQHVDKCW